MFCFRILVEGFKLRKIDFKYFYILMRFWVTEVGFIKEVIKIEFCKYQFIFINFR